MLIPKNGHFKVYHPKISLKELKIKIFFIFFSKIIRININLFIKTNSKKGTLFNFFLSISFTKENLKNLDFSN